MSLIYVIAMFTSEFTVHRAIMKQVMVLVREGKLVYSPNGSVLVGQFGYVRIQAGVALPSLVPGPSRRFMVAHAPVVFRVSRGRKLPVVGKPVAAHLMGQHG